MASFMPVEFAWTKRSSISNSTVTTHSGLSRIGFLLVLGGVFATVAQKREETETADA